MNTIHTVHPTPPRGMEGSAPSSRETLTYLLAPPVSFSTLTGSLLTMLHAKAKGSTKKNRATGKRGDDTADNSAMPNSVSPSYMTPITGRADAPSVTQDETGARGPKMGSAGRPAKFIERQPKTAVEGGFPPKGLRSLGKRPPKSVALRGNGNAAPLT